MPKCSGPGNVVWQLTEDHPDEHCYVFNFKTSAVDQRGRIAAIFLLEDVGAAKLPRFIFILILSLFFALAVRSQTQPPGAFVDNFDQPTLNSAWQLHPGDGQIALTANPGFLRYMLGAPQFSSTAPDDNSLWVFRQFSGDSWTLETKVTYSLSPSQNGRQMYVRIPFPDASGRNINEIRWWRDIDCCGPRNHIVVDFTDNGQRSTAVDFLPNAADTYVVRIIRKQQAIDVQVSPDGTTFSSVAQYTFATRLPSLQDVIFSSANFCCTGYADYDYVSVSSSCVNPSDVKPFAGTPFSRDGKPLSMNAAFAPTDGNGMPTALTSKAASCGFTDFNWQQEVVSLPAPSPFFPVSPGTVNPANLSLDGSFVAPPSFFDPPQGGGYILEASNGQLVPDYDNAYPFYWNSSDLAGNLPCSPAQTIPTRTANALRFQDCPGDWKLPNGAAIQFQTSLVGVCGPNATAAACNAVPPGFPSPPLLTWTWNSTFNGTYSNPSTGIGGAQLKSVFPLDPNSGSGGITITSINNVPQTPPVVSCTTNPTTLWPPNGKSVLVTISGTVTAGTQTISASGTTFAVTDKYGQDQPSGSITLAADGTYYFTIPLIAARDGSDLDGRTYTVNVTATDVIGNVGSCAAAVTIPHDQGH